MMRVECRFTVLTNQFANHKKHPLQYDQIENAAVRELSRPPRVESPKDAVNQVGPEIYQLRLAPQRFASHEHDGFRI